MATPSAASTAPKTARRRREADWRLSRMYCTWIGVAGSAVLALAGKPLLGGVEIGAAQEEAAVASGVVPLARPDGEARVLVDPRLVELERRDERLLARLRVVLVAQPDPVGLREMCGQAVRVDGAAHDGDDPLPGDQRVGELLGADLRRRPTSGLRTATTTFDASMPRRT